MAHPAAAGMAEGEAGRRLTRGQRIERFVPFPPPAVWESFGTSTRRTGWLLTWASSKETRCVPRRPRLTRRGAPGTNRAARPIHAWRPMQTACRLDEWPPGLDTI